jgi:hypothetical protein
MGLIDGRALKETIISDNSKLPSPFSTDLVDTDLPVYNDLTRGEEECRVKGCRCI